MERTAVLPRKHSRTSGEEEARWGLGVLMLSGTIEAAPFDWYLQFRRSEKKEVLVGRPYIRKLEDRQSARAGLSLAFTG